MAFGAPTGFASGIGYLDYAVILAYLDGSRAIRLGGKKPFEHAEEPRKNFADSCKKYRERIEKDLKGYAGRPGPSSSVPTSKEPGESPAIERWLYRPLQYVTWGNSDSLGIVLADDLDSLFSLTSHLKSPIEQVVLGFCPDLEKLYESPDDPVPANLVHPRDLWDGCTVDGSFPHQDRLPLLVVSRLKLASVVALDYGLRCQRVLVRKVADRIDKVLRGLERASRPSATARALKALEIIDTDVAETKVCILDTQGAEEMSVLVFTRNYSIAMSIILALRGLTLKDLTGMESKLRERERPAHDAQHALLELIGECSVSDATAAPTLMEDNHVFHSTYTSLCISVPALKRETRDFSGYVEAYVQLDVQPGHEWDVNWLVDDSARARVPEALKPEECDLLGIRRFPVGRHDQTVSAHQEAAGQATGLIPLVDFLGYFEQLLTNLMQIPSGLQGTHLTDICTRLVIPYPEELPEAELQIVERRGDNHISIATALHKLHGIVFGEANDRIGVLALGDLQDVLLAISPPYSLYRTIFYLHQNLSEALADTYSFHQVIDLYDIFLAFRRLLGDIRDRGDPHIAVAAAGQHALLGESVEDLVDLVTAIQNALSHRSFVPLQNTEMPDLAVDFRGGLYQILMAGDVPLKNGLALVRSLLESGESRKEGNHRDRFGAVTRLTFDSKVRLDHLLSTDDPPLCLASLSLGVTLVLRPGELGHFLHEIGHLLWEAAAGRDEDWRSLVEDLRDEGEPPTVGSVRIREIFANMVQFLFLFDADADLFLKYHITGYSLHLASVCRDDGRAVEQYAELLTRGFLAVDGFRNTSEARSLREVVAENLTQYSTVPPTGSGAPQRVHERFDRALAGYSRYWAAYDDRFHGERRCLLHEYCHAALDAAVDATRSTLGQLADKAALIYEEHLARVFGASAREKLDDLSSSVKENLEQGIPVVFPVDEVPWHDADLATTIPACTVVREYLRLLHEDLAPNLGIHLYRNRETGSVDYAGAPDRWVGRGWAPFQIDYGSGGLYSVDPRARRRRVRMQVTVLKSLWGISTSLRGKRLRAMIDGTC